MWVNSAARVLDVGCLPHELLVAAHRAPASGGGGGGVNLQFTDLYAVPGVLPGLFTG